MLTMEELQIIGITVMLFIIAIITLLLWERKPTNKEEPMSLDRQYLELVSGPIKIIEVSPLGEVEHTMHLASALEALNNTNEQRLHPDFGYYAPDHKMIVCRDNIIGLVETDQKYLEG